MTTAVIEVPTIADIPIGTETHGPLGVPNLAAAQAYADVQGYPGGYYVTSNHQAYFLPKGAK